MSDTKGRRSGEVLARGGFVETPDAEAVRVEVDYAANHGAGSNFGRFGCIVLTVRDRDARVETDWTDGDPADYLAAFLTVPEARALASLIVAAADSAEESAASIGGDGA